jgi:putative ABC transport system substrate-binding protein
MIPNQSPASLRFRRGLQDLGWSVGRYIQMDVRWAPGNFGDNRKYAAELVALAPDAILASTTVALGPLLELTRTIPIVFVNATDPVGGGYVEGLARPGGNATGFLLFEYSMSAKWLELLKEVVPGITRVAVLQNPDHPAWNAYLRAVGAVASGMRVEVTAAPVNTAAEIQAAIDAFARVPNGGLVLLPSPVATTHREVIASAALRHGLPSIYLARIYPVSGGLMSYGIDLNEPYRQAAAYVDRILKGVKPGELPVQAASKFEMVINLKTAKALGITVPPTVLGRADEVIE